MFNGVPYNLNNYFPNLLVKVELQSNTIDVGMPCNLKV
jgi:hypothetical protein